MIYPGNALRNWQKEISPSGRRFCFSNTRPDQVLDGVNSFARAHSI
jgi:hypothetical protein